MSVKALEVLRNSTVLGHTADIALDIDTLLLCFKLSACTDVVPCYLLIVNWTEEAPKWISISMIYDEGNSILKMRLKMFPYSRGHDHILCHQSNAGKFKNCVKIHNFALSVLSLSAFIRSGMILPRNRYMIFL